MPDDRIVDPEEITRILRAYVDGTIGGIEAAHRALGLAGSTDRILAGHQTRLVIEAYWTLRRLAETGPGAPGRDEIRFLLDCLEGRRRYNRRNGEP
ncbi:MAG TPA: hypothetical protein VGK94_05220 [Candidatus Polarisedimenticolia bacterium]